MFTVSTTLSKRTEADLIIFPFFCGKQKAKSCVDPEDLREVIDPILAAEDFKGKQGATLLVYLSGKKEKRLLFLGLGEEKKCSMEVLRRAYAAAIKRCQNKQWKCLNVVMPEEISGLSVTDLQRSVAEGIALTLYTFDEWQSEKNKKPYFVEKITLIGSGENVVGEKVSAIVSGVNLARDLIHGNACDITPQALADTAKSLAKEYSAVKAKIFGKKEIEKEKMGLLLAVASGSRCDPALIQLEYTGNPKSQDTTLIVGKGVTFDTGGLNLKPTGFIEDMSTDMSGAGAALGVIKAAAESKLKANIAVLIPSTENAIDANSYKPGDVYRSYKGISVEITNTDAEGRLILADALSYGIKTLAPNRVIDLATLTGAVVVAIGGVRMGLFSNDKDFSKQCIEAGEKTGELVWQLPLDADYKEALKSSVADIKNCSSKRAAGSVTAAIFLQQFIEENIPWIHLDIAGTARLDEPKHYHSTVTSGSAVRLLIELIERVNDAL